MRCPIWCGRKRPTYVKFLSFPSMYQQLRRLLPGSQWINCTVGSHVDSISGPYLAEPLKTALLACRPLHHLFERCNFRDMESCPHILWLLSNSNWCMDSVLKQLTLPLSSHIWCAGPILLHGPATLLSCLVNCRMNRWAKHIYHLQSLNQSAYHVFIWWQILDWSLFSSRWNRRWGGARTWKAHNLACYTPVMISSIMVFKFDVLT